MKQADVSLRFTNKGRKEKKEQASDISDTTSRVTRSAAAKSNVSI